MEKVLSSKIVFECPIFKVEEAEVELRDNSKAKRWYVVKNGAVAILCIKDNKVLMLKEYRSASGTFEWRVPAGGMKEGEDPKEAAKRELREEVGLEPLDLTLIKEIKKPSSSVKQTVYCYIATRFKENPLSSGEKEERDIKIYELGRQEIEKLLSNFEIPEGMSWLYKILKREYLDK